MQITNLRKIAAILLYTSFVKTKTVTNGTQKRLWARPDLNRRPSGYEPDALGAFSGLPWLSYGPLWFVVCVLFPLLLIIFVIFFLKVVF